MKQLNGVGETARIATERGYRNKQHRLIRAKALTANCLNLGAYIGASRADDGLHWDIEWRFFEKWLSKLSVANLAINGVLLILKGYWFPNDEIFKDMIIRDWIDTGADDPDVVNSTIKIIWSETFSNGQANGLLLLPGDRSIKIHKHKRPAIDAYSVEEHHYTVGHCTPEELEQSEVSDESN